MEVYYYVPSSILEDSICCGLKLSESYDTEVLINGVKRKCFSAFITPRDDMSSYNNDELVCIKLEVPNDYCVITEKYYKMFSDKFPEFYDLYTESIIESHKYIFGMYRLPECLVFTSIIGEQISILNRKKDSPILFDKSEEIYLNNYMEDLNEKYDDIQDMLLYCFLDRLTLEGKYKKSIHSKIKTASFKEKKTGKLIITKLPELDIQD